MNQADGGRPTSIMDLSGQVLSGEVDLLRAQIAERKPKGGRTRLADERVAEIERDIEAGYSRRQVAARTGVSAMTVQRVAERLARRLEAF